MIAVLIGVVALPRAARPFLEHRLSRVLGVPVKIGALGWKPIRGIVTAEGVTIGPPGRSIVLGRANLDFMLQGLARGQIAFDSIELSNASVTAELDRNLELKVAAFEGMSPIQVAIAAPGASPPML